MPRVTQIQLRPEYANPQELVDLRVRRGLAHAIDTPALVEALTGGYGVASGTLTAPLAEYRPELEAAITKYPYDPRAAQRLWEAAGLQRESNGFYASPVGGAFNLDVYHIAGATNARENAIIVDNLVRAGLNTAGHVYTVQQVNDNETRAKLPGLFTGGGSGGEAMLQDGTIAAIPTPANRWRGGNRGGYVNAEYDRIWNTFNTTLDQAERIRQIVAMERIFSEEVPAIAHYYTPRVNAFVPALHGPTGRKTPESGSPLSYIYTWEWRT